MKKILLLSLALGGCLELVAQSYSNRGSRNSWTAISVGLRFGGTAARMTNDFFFDEDDATIKPGFQGGLAASFAPVGPIFHIQPELNFIQKGFREDGDDFQATRTLNNLEIPVLLKGHFGPENAKVAVYAGGHAAYLLSGTEKVEIGGEEESENLVFNDDSNPESLRVNRWELGVTSGLGFGFNAGGGTLWIDLRATLGLTDFYDLADKPSNYEPTKNQVFGISLNYMLPVLIHKL